MKIEKFVPYDKNLISRARELRRNQTEAEKIFWLEILKSKKFSSYKFTRQKPLDGFIADFYCAKFKLAIEIDGEMHEFQKVRDKERDNILLQKFGIKVLRYKNKDVLGNSNKIITDLLHYLR
jgi:very-short-patch-repair endonuclease